LRLLAHDFDKIDKLQIFKELSRHILKPKEKKIGRSRSFMNMSMPVVAAVDELNKSLKNPVYESIRDNVS